MTVDPDEFAEQHRWRFLPAAFLLLVCPNGLLLRFIGPLERWVWGQRVT